MNVVEDELRRVCARQRGLTVAICMLVIGCADVDDKTTMRSLAITDEHGRVRIELSADSRRGPVITLRDSAGVSRVSVGVGEEPDTGGAWFALCDETGITRLRGGARGDVGTVVLYDREGIQRLSAGVDGRGPGIVLYGGSDRNLRSVSIEMGCEPANASIAVNTSDSRVEVSCGRDDAGVAVERQGVRVWDTSKK